MFKVTLLDRAIATFSPQTALKRARARAAFEAVRGYEGAARDRRRMSWHATNASADAEIAAAGYILRERSRDLVRNNPHAAKAVSVWVQNLVGDGIMPRIRDKKLNDLWSAWQKVCDADGQLPFAGIQTLAVREMVEAGEVLIRRRYRRKTDGVPGNMQVQVLEADHLDTSKNRALNDGGCIIQGVEFDKQGRRVAYWLFPIHPGHNVLGLAQTIVSERIPASEVIHLYDKQRTQARGVPWGAPVMTAMRDLAAYEDAELTRKKIEACMVGILVGGDEGDGIGIPLRPDEEAQDPGIYDNTGAVVEKFEPGMFAIARGGRDVKFNTPAATGSFPGYKSAALHSIASGWRLPYEALTGDLSQVNYSSIRAGLVEFRRLVSALQANLIIPTLCEGLFDWFVEAHQYAGLLPLDGPMDAIWSPPKFAWVDPLKDITADLLAVRAGIRSMPDVISEQGRDPEVVLREIAEWNGKLDAAGVILDSDPRQTAKNGALQITVNAGDAPPGDGTSKQ